MIRRYIKGKIRIQYKHKDETIAETINFHGNTIITDFTDNNDKAALFVAFQYITKYFQKLHLDLDDLIYYSNPTYEITCITLL